MPATLLWSLRSPWPSPGAPANENKLPALVQPVLPEVHVEETRWHPDASRRLARVEVDGVAREVQEGDALGPLVVSSIEPSGVVFTHDGVEMRRRIGE